VTYITVLIFNIAYSFLSDCGRVMGNLFKQVLHVLIELGAVLMLL